jgi:hypothetical protein
LIQLRDSPSASGLKQLDAENFETAKLEFNLPVARIVLFLTRHLSPLDRRVIDRCVALAAESRSCRVYIVSSMAVHLGDRAWQLSESAVREQFEPIAEGSRIVLRVGNLGDVWTLHQTMLRLLAPLHPLIGTGFRSCFLTEQDLYSAIEWLIEKDSPLDREVYTLLGANRPLGDVLKQHQARNIGSRMLTSVARAVSYLSIHRAMELFYKWLARRIPILRMCCLDTLEPSSASELMNFYNPLNLPHVAIAGYNTGVTHFGWKYPGRTVVKTTGCGKRVRVHNDMVDVDAGVTLKRVVAELAAVDRELYVLPNYSYISMGTTFIVPVHGSGSEVSTLGETIDRAMLYDPKLDRIVRVRRGDPAFSRYMYHPSSRALVLRLRFRTRKQSRYFVRRTTIEAPTAGEIWKLFHDPEATNIEMRKSRAASPAVEVLKYYSAATSDNSSMEVPKDSIGRLWDRLEENAVTSWLFHALVRRFGFHVELFLDEREFAVFWEAHRRLPLSKIQLRFVRRDDLPHSPIGFRDCISADLFMRRSQSETFLQFMREHLPHAKFNPGKHSV